MSKTTRKTYSPQFKMRVALEVAKEQETLSQVAAKHGISPSLAASWRDELLAGADDIFGKAGFTKFSYTRPIFLKQCLICCI